MLRKSIMALSIASIAALATVSMSSAASAKKGGHHWGGHHHGHHFYLKRTYVRGHYAPSCRYYKKKWKWTGKKYWYKKYKACLYYKY